MENATKNITVMTARFRVASLRSQLLSTLEDMCNRIELAQRSVAAGNLPLHRFAQMGAEVDVLSRTLEELHTVLDGLEFEGIR